MRWFWSRYTPPANRILLVESGPRELGVRALAMLHRAFGEQTPIDVLRCVEEPPEGAAESWDVRDHRGFSGRLRLIRLLRRRRPPVTAILAGPDPIMAPWRWLTAAAMPSKILVVNENADFFWLDRGNLSTLVGFVQRRSGFADESALRSLARLATFPFVFVYLLAYAAWVHGMRACRGVLGLGRATG